MNFNDAKKTVRDKIRLEDLVDEYATPARSDSVNRWYRCPFPDHNDNTPSFVVNTERQNYKCFGCGKYGDVFSFIMEMENIPFMEALKKLAKRVNVDLNIDYNASEDNRVNNELYKIYMDAVLFYHETLKKDIGKFGRDYIEKRKLNNETVIKFAIGYAPGEPLYLYNHLKELGYDDKIINESGLVNFGEKGKNDFLYDARVIFPITDEFNKVIAIDGRTIGSAEQKYKNSKESIIFKKSDNLFGLQYARKTEKDYFIMCEGNIDCISLHQAGYDNSIAILGTNLSDNQIKKIKKYVNKVYLALDNDKAGIIALKKHAPVLIKNKISVYVIDLSPAKDPDEFLVKYGKEEFDKKIVNAKEYVISLCDLLKNEYNLDDVVEYEEYLNSISEALSLYDSPAIRYKYILNVAKTLSSSEREIEVLSNDLSARIVKIIKSNDVEIKKNNNTIINKHKENDKENIDSVNKTELSFIINLLDGKFKDNIDLIKNELNADDFSDNEIRYIYECILNNKTPNDILNSIDENDIKYNKLKKILFYSDKTINAIKNINEEDANINKNTNFDYLVTLIKKIKISKLEIKRINASLNEILEIDNIINEINNKVYKNENK